MPFLERIVMFTQDTSCNATGYDIYNKTLTEELLSTKRMPIYAMKTSTYRCEGGKASERCVCLKGVGLVKV